MRLATQQLTDGRLIFTSNSENATLIFLKEKLLIK